MYLNTSKADDMATFYCIVRGPSWYMFVWHTHFDLS